MNKKISFPIVIIILVICAVLVGGLVIWQYLRMPMEIKVVETKSSEKKTFDDKNCDELEDKIKSMLDEVNYCESDSDCIFESRYYCPFGCYQFFNKNADLQEIDDKVKILGENNCRFCEYVCIEFCDVKCVNNKCVGIRCQN